ncbi:MAG: DUF6754 domain-containing protein [Anaerolineae bacterium]
MDNVDRLLLGLALAFVGLHLFYTERARAGRVPELRRLGAFQVLREMMARAVEAGRTLHLSLGSGGIATETTADSLAGLWVLDYFSEQAAAAGVPPLVSMADPTLMLLAQDTLRRAHGDDLVGARRSSEQVRWIAPEPAAYAAGVMGILNIEGVQANAMVGKFGDEYLLMGETGARFGADITQVGAASDPSVLPFVYVSTDEMLLGEEMYAAGAYLSQKPAHVGSLLAQDTLRWIVALFILGAILLRSFGLIG